MLLLRNTPEREKPRYKLKQYGVEYLEDWELLATILGSGIKGCDVFNLAKKILQFIDKDWPKVDFEAMQKIPGIGKSKAGVITAALEFARRRIKPNGVCVKAPQDILPLVQYLACKKQEHFICISLNGAHEVIATRIVTIGLINCCQIHPREVFADPICDRAAAIIVAHNHPSGQLKASAEDIEVTKRLNEVSSLIGIKLLDHVIFTQAGYLSFREEGISGL